MPQKLHLYPIIENLSNMPHTNTQFVDLQCDTCNKRVRKDIDTFGIDLLNKCTLTLGCIGRLRRILAASESKRVSSLPTTLDNLSDWVQRKVLHTHNQAVPSVSWIVEHNLAINPTIQVFIDDPLTGLQNEVKNINKRIIDNNTIEIIFDNPQTGIAQMFSVNSKNIVNPPLSTTTQTLILPLTNNGELTIATIDSATFIDLDIIYTHPITETDIVVNYTNIDNIASIDSSWVGTQKIFINGITLTVRSFNILTHPNALTHFESGDIINGSTIRFNQPSSLMEQIILWGHNPHSVVDRELKKFIDIYSVSEKNADMFYEDGIIKTNERFIKTTYPPIFIL